MDIRTVLSDLAAGKVSEQRIAFLKDRLDAMEREKANLNQELAELRAEVADLQEKLRSEVVRPAQHEFEEAMGAAFKRKPGGGYEHVVYCPGCRTSTRFEPGFEAYICGRCSWAASFGKADLDQILSELLQ